MSQLCGSITSINSRNKKSSDDIPSALTDATSSLPPPSQWKYFQAPPLHFSHPTSNALLTPSPSGPPSKSRKFPSHCSTLLAPMIILSPLSLLSSE